MSAQTTRNSRPGRDHQRGQSLVLIPLMLMVLLGMGALVIDLGNVYYCYEQLQAATQAAALAGANALYTNTAAVAAQTATQYSAAGVGDCR